jgi:sugar lactone lactonase YvrE
MRKSVLVVVFAASLAGCKLNDGPSISQITPTSGPQAGGTQLSITGAGFTSTSKVFVGGVEATNIQFSSSTSATAPSTTPGATTTPGLTTTTTLLATTPPGARLGVADIEVRNRDGQRDTRKGSFNFIGTPQISGFSPNQALAGANVTINGSGFEAGLSVNFGGNNATIVGTTPTGVTVTVPTQPAGQSVVTVTVLNPDGGSTSSQFTYGVSSASTTSTTTPTQSSTTETTTSGTITTVVGSGTKGFSADPGPVSSASLSGPSGVVVDSTGNVFIADTGNNRIREVITAGTISTVAGNGTANLMNGDATVSEVSGPTGLAIDGSNNVYIADTGNHAVRLLSGTQLSTIAGGNGKGNDGDLGLATAAHLSGPLAVALDSQGNLYIADTGNNRVRRVDVATKDISNFAGQSTGVSGPGSEGTPANTTSLRSPSGVTVDSLGNVYIADQGNFKVREVSLAGTITTFAGNGTTGKGGAGGAATAAQFGMLGGLCVDATNALYIADTGNNMVRVVESSNLQILTVAGNGSAAFSGQSGPAASAPLNAPVGVAINRATQALLIADSGDGSVQQVH